MDLLTVPAGDGADMKVRQVEEALSASSRDRSGPNDTSKADWSLIASARSPWRHAELATGPVQGAQRSTSSKSALCKGFRDDDDMMTDLKISSAFRG